MGHGAEVTGEDAEAVSGQGQILREESPGLPYWPEALARAFSQDLLKQRPPRDPLWKMGGSHT